MSNKPKTTVLKWARETSGYSKTDVIGYLKLKTINLTKIDQWEKGELQPSYPQLKKLAKLYNRPVALFYFPEPPQEDSIETEFRSLPQTINNAIPPDIRYLVRKAKIKQMDLEELHTGLSQKAEIFSWNEIFSKKDSGIKNDAKKSAKETREYLNISLETQEKSWKNTDEALKKWITSFENMGIWVFKDNFKKNNDYCGFCIYDINQRFPIIYINNGQPKVRQIFTLFHELGHILMGQGGIDFRTAPELESKYKEEEVFCNAFAGEFLVPSEALDYSKYPKDSEIENMAKKYKVSYEVILRKFLDRNIISNEDYSKKIDERNKRLQSILHGYEKKRKGGGNYFLTQKTYLGNKYIDMVFSKYYKQQISKEQVADYLDIKISSVSEMEGWL